jgi:hypothetical protein
VLAILKFTFLMCCQLASEVRGDRCSKVFAPAEREELQRFQESVARLPIETSNVWLSTRDKTGLDRYQRRKRRSGLA